MTGTTDDPFVTMLAILNSKIQAQADRISFLEDEHADLEMRFQSKCEDYAADLAGSRQEIETLRGDLRWYKSHADLLQRELDKIRLNDPEVKEKLATFMKEKGETLLHDGQKIECIKQIRILTGFGLKEAKDFVEQYKDATGRLLAPIAPFNDR
jgi:predicted RNase H-like nuclease (RuvC/YqgF family)